MRTLIGLCPRLLILILATLEFAGCAISPKARKQHYTESGQHYFENGKYSEASIEFVNALKIDNRDPDLHFSLAKTYIRLNQWPRSYEQLQQTIELQPGNFPARLELAKLLIASGSLQQAKEQSDFLLKQRSDDPKTHFIAGNLLAAQGNFLAAIAEFQKSVTLDPAAWDSYLNLALMEIKSNQQDLAEANFEKAIALNPKAVDARSMLGNFYQYRGRFAEAEQQFRGAIDVDPQNPDLRAQMARLYLSEGKRTDAEDFLKLVKRDFPNNSAGYRMLGDFYFTNGNLDKALAEYANLYHEHSRDRDVQKNYIQLLILTNHLDDARRANAEYAKNNPEDSEGTLESAQIQIRDGHVSDAIVTLQRLIQKDPMSAAGHYQLGVAYQQTEDEQSAEREWREAARIRPGLVEAQRSLALLAMRKGDMATLQQAATQLINLRPASPEGYALRAVSEINLKQFVAAEADVHQTIQAAPNGHLGYVQLGNLKSSQQQYADAVKAYQQALSLNPNSADALRGLMNVYIAQKQIDKAVNAVQGQIGAFPNNGDFYDLLGTVLFNDKRDLKAAEAALRKSIELNGKNPDPVIKLSRLMTSQGRVDEAINIDRQGLKDHPRELAFWLQLGDIYQSKHAWSDAEDAYQHALAVSPENALASGELAYAMLQAGQNLDVALSLAQTARRGLPQSPRVADILGSVYYHKGAYSLAVDSFRQALILDSEIKSADNSRIHYHLGMAYSKTGQSALAREQWQFVMKVAPDSESAVDAKKQLAELKS